MDCTAQYIKAPSPAADFKVTLSKPSVHLHVQCIFTYMFYWQAKASGKTAEECDKIGDEIGVS
ncbi:hypothetical protein BHE74_00025379 [Ensete ventricosum]|uniref:Uncharacterized protein n=1 Tax=Ensete ventricosum TaxID=4639 RepID=A0A427A7T0_ENSVE|nr:hypothetical protein B296_00020275 [Ensete ventricosum]RWW67189.1 hypothetical protein BHE74_00025379 [Ensete ventricosum]RZR87974.1 hypothetical protein BHM03_00015447 [Ensete ventricosum]